MSFTLTVDTSELRREMAKLEQSIPQAHLELQAEVIGLTIDDLVVRSPVLTGAYRASHAVGIGTGDGEAAILVYDSPEHPDPAVDLKPGAQPYPQVPDGALARASYEAEEPFRRAVIFNDRRYAGDLEYGNATMAPRSIYATAEVVAEQNARQLADGFRLP